MVPPSTILCASPNQDPITPGYVLPNLMVRSELDSFMYNKVRRTNLITMGYPRKGTKGYVILCRG